MNESDGGPRPENGQDNLADLVRKVRSEVLPYDPTLENLVALTNLLDTVEIGITLQIKGLVVSGMLISARSYFNLLVHELKESNSGNFLAGFYEPALQEQTDAREKYRTDDILPPRPLHLHMRQALTYVTLGNEPLVSRLWRGRLTQVDAWSMGNYGTAPPPLPADLAE